MRVHVFRQSDLNTFFKCPEQLRLRLAGELPFTETDATAIGTAMHAGIEAVRRGVCDPDAGLAAALAEWDRLHPTITSWVQIKTPETGRSHVEKLYLQWLEHVYPQLATPVAIEHKFHVLLHHSSERQIWLKGAIDEVATDGVWDWKTASQPYEQWEVDRFKIQPTFYGFAAAQDFPDLFPSGIVPFTYGVSLKGNGKKPQVLSCVRGPRHYEWLERQLIGLALLVEADLPSWPLNDQGWWCSGKWCPVWDSCKGAHVS